MFFASRTVRMVCGLVFCVIFGGCVHNFPQHLALNEQGNVVNPPILLYHHIAVLPLHTSKAMRRWTLSPKIFEAQMDWVTNHGFHTITMEQLIGHLKHGAVLPPKPIVLTFDDGLKGRLQYCLPDPKETWVYRHLLYYYGFGGAFGIYELEKDP